MNQSFEQTQRREGERCNYLSWTIGPRSACPSAPSTSSPSTSSSSSSPKVHVRLPAAEPLTRPARFSLPLPFLAAGASVGQDDWKGARSEWASW